MKTFIGICPKCGPVRITAYMTPTTCTATRKISRKKSERCREILLSATETRGEK